MGGEKRREMQHRSAESKNNSRITNFLKIVADNGVINEWKVVRQAGITPKQYQIMKPLLTNGYDDLMDYNPINHNFSWIAKGTIQKEVIEEKEEIIEE